MIEKFEFLKDEFWYGGIVDHGENFPLTHISEYFINFDENFSTHSQTNPVFFSNKGRYFWLENGGSVEFKNGIITVNAPEIEFCDNGKTLKEAASLAAEKHYPPSGKMPDERAFTSPQYCSWTVLLWSQNQQKILEYARSIVREGFKPGIIIIDDTWQKDYGVWDFNPANFPAPEAMFKELKELGFIVSLWLCPYISPDSPKTAEYAPWMCDHMAAGRVILSDDKSRPRFSAWWEGWSAQLDFIASDFCDYKKEDSPAKKWINLNTKRLMDEYGVAGFKLDGGDPEYFEKDYPHKNLQSTLWIDSVNCDFKEARCCYKLANKPIIWRLNDKKHAWKSQENALALSSLLPCILTQGLAGYAFGCPDMVGGGLAIDFIDKSNLDDELIIRWCQASALLPMIQFSLDVWNRKQNRVAEICKKTVALREKFTPYLLEKLREAAKNGVPAVRYMAYEFPNCGFERVVNQFMLGEKYLVAPVLEKGATCREIVFPDGKWKDIYDGKVYEGGAFMVPAPIDKLPVFEKIG